MKFIYVAGSYGSGTTAVAGALYCSGIYSLPPYFLTSDVRTKNSYESKIFRNSIIKFIDEKNLIKKNYPREIFLYELNKIKKLIFYHNEIHNKISNDNTYFLKMPISALCLEEIIEVFDPYIVLVKRPFSEIEASRMRRGWGPAFGRKGASKIYSTLKQTMSKTEQKCVEISYQKLISNPTVELKKIFDHAEIDISSYDLDAGAKFVRARSKSS